MKRRLRMESLEEEKELVRGMMSSGMTLAEVARELDKSIFWVYSRYKDNYAPIKDKIKKTLMSRREKLEDRLKRDRKELESIKERRIKIEEELNYSPHRSREELEEYRKRRDKDVKIAGAVPKFDDD